MSGPGARKALAELIPAPCDVDLASSRCSSDMAIICLSTECDCPETDYSEEDELRICGTCWAYLARLLATGQYQGACVQCDGSDPWEVAVQWDDGRRAALRFVPANKENPTKEGKK